MRKTTLSIFLAISLFGCAKKLDDSHFLDAGISIQLADFRKEQISDIHYQLDFSLPEKLEDPIPSNLNLELNLSRIDQPLILDFNEKSSHLLSLKVNGMDSEIHHEQEHLIISSDLLKEGANQIEIEFLAGELSLNRNQDFLYTLLVPDRASTLFPCFDQPNLKANYSLTLTTPEDWKVLAGGPEISQENKGEFTKHIFAKSDLMSTYLFSFVAGKFDEAINTETLPQKVLYRETNADKIEESIPEQFKLHQQAVNFLESYTDYPFPFQKIDFATIPIFQYGGMEHVGAIQYRESALFYDENATESELLGRAKLIGHETAHMWFGDLVTMRWFNDVWMKEVFANFMAGKIVNPNFPNINHVLLFLTSNYPSAYAEDRTWGTNPIRQELANLKNAGSLYGNIIYSKAPIMMRQLETTIGEEAFQKGIQEYIRDLANTNADWNDLVTRLDKQSKIDLKKWSEVWVNQSSRPIFEENLQVDENGKITEFSIKQTAEDGTGKIWPQLFEITFLYPEGSKSFAIDIQDQTLEIKEAIGMDQPLAILYNSNGMGYGVFPINEKSIDQLTQFDGEVGRAQTIINLYENTLAGKLSPEKALESFLPALEREENEILFRLISGYTSSIFWDFLNEDQRETMLPVLEKSIWDQLQTTKSANIKKGLYSLYSGIAYNSTGLKKLYQIWDEKLAIPNLKLNQDDYTGLAMKLALFGHPDSETILEKERAKLENPDKIKRFDFLLPSLSQDASVRDSLFVSFKDAKNREKESWVLTACDYINHPLRQAESIKHVPLALDLIQEIQLTGDIFFPKRWAVSTFGQYQDPRAWKEVQAYLERHPELDRNLKNKILQASDNLRRAQDIIKN
ncbi:M1 family metallopeptidase [Algoriphagus zhangzhouensis]|uniref:Aminopeptidase N n=1 Tax=Algoriphagus zhangzhouensis TaxID=1073327 RepID=A0A1M7Z8M3_9BACT|nr:M1 family aminopeptidase [Algoriphagus zhangzhouensis]TDY47577.1 aminopeptidase N [Algoriphagus zhangzhouensis]SHO61268.1 aminopeptidase N [Algoriphagus zhangzhouensis]